MAEEQEQSTGGGTSIKQVLIGLVSTITLGVGGWITTKLTGDKKEEDKPAAATPIIINNSQQAAPGGKTVVIKEKTTEAKPAATAQPAKPKKKEGDEFKEEAPKW